MRVAFFLTVFPAVSETFILNQITGLIDRGHEVDIIALRAGPTTAVHENVLRYGLLERLHLPRPVPRPGIRRLTFAAGLAVRALRLHGLRVIRWFGITPELRRNTLRLMAIRLPHGGRYDILQCHYGTNGNLVAELKRIGVVGGRIFTMFHGYDIRDGVHRGGGIYRPLRGDGVRVQAISPYNRRNLETFGIAPEQIIDHPIGVDPRAFDPTGGALRQSQAGAAVGVVTVARLVVEKGLEHGLRAFRRLRDERPELAVRYQIVGDGPLRSDLERLTRELGLADVVEFAGAQPTSGVAARLREASLFFLPSVDEALPTVIMEAMSAHLPVVATDVGSVGVLVRDGITGILVAPRDVEAMSEGLARLVEDEGLRRRMGSAGRELIEERYDIDSLNDRLEASYLQALRESPV